MNFSPAIITWITLIALTLGLILWWIKRDQKQKWPLPILKVLKLPDHPKPQLVITPPSIIPFLCFTISGLGLLFLTFKPKELTLKPFASQKLHDHILVDLSPSMSAHITIPEILQKIESLQNQNAKTTLSTTISPEVYTLPIGDLTSLISDFQRDGVYLGATLKKQVLEDVDRLFIISDGDAHSWKNFEWTYLKDEMDVILIDVSKERLDDNVFISSAKLTSAVQSNVLEWEVKIERRGPMIAPIPLQLQVTYQGQLLAKKSLSLNSQDTLAKISWPQDANMKVDGKTPLVFEVIPERPDSIGLDNIFRAPFVPPPVEVLLVSESTGESMLEDPISTLNAAFSANDVKVVRHEKFSPNDSTHYPLLILADSFQDLKNCPAGPFASSFRGVRGDPSAALGMTASSGSSSRLAPGDQGAEGRLTQIWLMKTTTESVFDFLCQCADLFVTGTKNSEYCKGVNQPRHFAEVMKALGASQIGGDVGEIDKAVGWIFTKENLEVSVFTYALLPEPFGAFNVAKLPVIVRSLLSWQNISKKLQTQSPWASIPDFSVEFSDQFKEQSLRNVPTGESLLQKLPQGDLPPLWNNSTSQNAVAKTTEEDPTPWIQFVANLIGVCLLVELLYYGLKNKSQILLMALIFITACPDVLLGSVEFVMVESPAPQNSFQQLGQDISQRTSLSFAKSPKNFQTLGEPIFAEPWIWTSKFSTFVDTHGNLRDDVKSWLRRGGFLVIEENWSVADLKNSTKKLSLQNDENWFPVPPDHELMRSFYLLDSLPQCAERVWYALKFDQRLAAVAIPFSLSSVLSDSMPPSQVCQAPYDRERLVRVFINILLVALTTDYKKDQIHMKEILKRLQ